MRAILAWCTVALVCTFAGLMTDPAIPGAMLHPPAWLSPPARTAAVTPLSIVVASSGIALFGRGVLLTIRHARATSGAGVLLLVAMLGAGGILYDTIVDAFELGTVPIFEHASVLGSVLMSYVLLRRFALAADTLEDRTRDLQQAYAELRHVEAELVRKEQLAAVGELSAVIAHEVRTPLSVLKNSVSSLRHEAIGDADRSTLLGILDEESDRLNRLVRDLLAYARPINPQLGEVPLEPLLHRAADAAMRELGRDDLHRVDVGFDLRGAPANVRADRDLLERAITNLIENGIQAMPEGGMVTVRVRESIGDEGPTIRIVIQDQGEGMDTLVRSRARIPFFTTRPSGTGLGLAIVERVIRAHGGQLDLAAAAERGTSATITLPHPAGSTPLDRGARRDVREASHLIRGRERRRSPTDSWQESLLQVTSWRSRARGAAPSSPDPSPLRRSGACAPGLARRRASSRGCSPRGTG
jgi:signal transduction histidine kinase